MKTGKNFMFFCFRKILFVGTVLMVGIMLSRAPRAWAAPSVEWDRALGGSADDIARCIQQTDDGGYIVAGETSSNDGDVSGNHGDMDFWVVKLKEDGMMDWQRALGGSGRDRGYSVRQTRDRGYIVAGYSESNDGDVSGNHGKNDCWIVKLKENGMIDWQKSLGGSNDDGAYFVQQTKDGGYIVAGYSESNDGDVSGNRGDADFWIVKLKEDGMIDWQKSLGGSDSDIALSAQQTEDGGYIVAGRSWSKDGDVTGNHGSGDSWVVKLEENGAMAWRKSLGGSRNDSAYSIQQTKDGGYIVAGDSNSKDGDVSENYGYTDFWVVKLKEHGAIDWQKSLAATRLHDDTPRFEHARSIQQAEDGGYIVAGWCWNFWVVKLRGDGTLNWQRTLGGTFGERAYSIQQTRDRGYIIAGESSNDDGDVSDNHGGTDFWVVKLETE